MNTMRIKQQGFTLIEIMVVVVIMGLLIGLIGPNVIGQVDKANVTAAKSDMATLSQALDMYKLDNQMYPSNDQGLEALVKEPEGTPPARNWNPGGYLKGTEIPLDPWGGEYQYFSPGEDGKPYEILTLGADGKLGGDGYDKDLTNWDK